MKLRLKNLVRKFYLRRDRIWHVYISSEIQSKAKDKEIINFPRLKPEDLDYEYMFNYVKEWIDKKYTKNKFNFLFENIDGCEYVCKTKKCANLSKILARIHKDYKEIFLSKLERLVVDPPKVEEPKSGAAEPEGNVKGSKALAKQSAKGQGRSNVLVLG
ncbi:hypothetical protein [Borreliella burgdorferi]|uniref:hypothetical protein n=1 Tax=Borreliella burgdorferi TaxID=139 RepID=UPI003DA29FC8